MRLDIFGMAMEKSLVSEIYHLTLTPKLLPRSVKFSRKTDYW